MITIKRLLILLPVFIILPIAAVIMIFEVDDNKFTKLLENTGDKLFKWGEV